MFLSKILVLSCMIIHRGRKDFCRYCLQALVQNKYQEFILKTALNGYKR